MIKYNGIFTEINEPLKRIEKVGIYRISYPPYTPQEQTEKRKGKTEIKDRIFGDSWHTQHD